ncbi:MAG: hypothetical protein U0Y68_16185 [Blastocatellia bacterium]
MSEPSSVNDDFVASFWHWVKRPHWSVAAPILLVAFTGVFAWQIFLSGSALDEGLSELSAAYRDARPLEARLAGFSYAPYTGGRVQANEQKCKTAERIFAAQMDKQKTAAAFYALGKLSLAQGKFDSALEQFDAALKSDAQLAALHNDLGVALMEKAWQARGNQPIDFTASRTHWEHAMQADRNATEPLFNQALSLQRQGMWEQAEAAWQLYLKNDVRSGWATEAKRYLEEITGKRKQPPTAASR